MEWEFSDFGSGWIPMENRTVEGSLQHEPTGVNSRLWRFRVRQSASPECATEHRRGAALA
jgi:hypothetical protein